MRTERQGVFWIVALAIAVLAIGVLSDALLPFAVAAALAYFLNPAADALERLGLGRGLSAALVIGVGALALTAALFLLLPLAATQLRQLAQTLPDDLERLRVALEAWAAQHLGGSFSGFKTGLQRALDALAESSASLASATAQLLWSRGAALINLVSLVLVTPVVAFYLLRDWHSMLARIDAWLPRAHAPTIRSLAADVDRAVGAFVRGQGTICLILGVYYAVALSLAGLRYGLVIGLATGLLAFIPMVGWAVGLIVALTTAVAHGWPEPTLALWVLGIYAAGMALDSAFLSPQIVGHKVGLHPVWLMLALFVFSALFGFLGVIVAVPVAAALGVLVRFGRDRYLVSGVYLGDRANGPAPEPPQTGT